MYISFWCIDLLCWIINAVIHTHEMGKMIEKNNIIVIVLWVVIILPLRAHIPVIVVYGNIAIINEFLLEVYANFIITNILRLHKHIIFLGKTIYTFRNRSMHTVFICFCYKYMRAVGTKSLLLWFHFTLMELLSFRKK